MKASSLLSKIFNHDDGELHLMFDIESTRVRGILTFVQKNKVPTIVGVSSKHISTRGHAHEDYNTRQAGILNALKLVSEEIVRSIIPNIDQTITQKRHVTTIDFILASPWSFVRTKTITENYDTTRIVSSKDIERILESERAEFKEIYTQGKFAENFDFDLEFIEEYIIDIKQNGYSVSQIEKARVQKLDISYISGIASKNFLKEMKRAVHTYIHAEKETVHSSLVLQYTALRNIILEDEYVWVHVHGGVTDIVSILRGIPRSFATLPFGLKHITEKVAHSLKISVPIAESTIGMFAHGHHDTSAHLSYSLKKDSEKVQEALNKAGKDWFDAVVQEFRSLNEVSVLPAHMYVWAHENSTFFGEQLTKNDLPHDIVARDRLKSENITFGFIENYVAFNITAHKSLLVGMYAIALYNRVLK